MSASDVVLKISLPGHDVKTATPEECAIHSDYDTLKLKLDNGNPYFQRIVVNFVTNPPVGTINVFTFTYDLPNVPAWLFFFSPKDSSFRVDNETGNLFDLDIFQGHYFSAYRQGNKIKLDFTTNDSGSFNMVASFCEFRFFCYANDGL